MAGGAAAKKAALRAEEGVWEGDSEEAVGTEALQAVVLAGDLVVATMAAEV